MTISERRLLDDLARFVAVRSVSADPGRVGEVERSADAVAAAFREVGVDATVATAAGGLPAVVGRLAGPPEAPTVLLYAHHDVQPVGDPGAWRSDPFTLTARNGRLYGRGTADDKGGVALHLEAIRALGPEPPVSVAVLVEGEEEVGSPTLAALLADHADLARADVVLAPDAVNAGPLAPTLTVSLRGILNVLVTVRTADRRAHSGIFGGAVPDALGALIRLLATLTDSDGAVTIGGLHPGVDAGNGPDAADVRADSGLSPDVEFVGRGSLGERLWNGPAVTITGIDAPAAAGAANVLVPVARAAVSVRLAPEDDPVRALHALTKHLHAHAPWGAAVKLEAVASGRGWRATTGSPRWALAREALGGAFGSPASLVGVGGSIPFVATLAGLNPEADVLVTAVQDPRSRAHAANESVTTATLVAATRAEVQMLRSLGRPAPSPR